MTSLILIFFTSLIVGYYSKKKLFLGTLDPLKMLPIQEAIWTTTVAELYSTDYISINNFLIYITTILAWWFSWAIISKSGSQKYKETIKKWGESIISISIEKYTILLIIFSVSLLIFYFVSFSMGGGGDERLKIMKLLRPIEGFIVLLAPVIFLRLMVKRSRSNYFVMTSLLGLLVASGGKSAIFVLLLPITIAELTGFLKLKLQNIIIIIAIMAAGIMLSATINYGASSFLAALGIIINRITLEGDVYILAFQNRGFDGVEINSLMAYVFSPILKIMMIDIMEKNIGAQISSYLQGDDLITGPNGHWPILLIATGFDNVFTVLLISIIFFVFVIAVKCLFLNIRLFNSLPKWFSLPLVSFLMQYPQTFFADPPYLFVYLIHVIIVSTAICIIFLPFEISEKSKKV